MTSAIVTNTINEAFPVAGVDNNSQGFRTNFSTIKTSLIAAASEISDLQDNVVRTDQHNDLNNSILENFVAKNMQQSVISGPTNQSINYWDVSGTGSGHYWTAVANGNETIILRNWPVTGSNPKYYKIRIQLKSNGSANIITLGSQGGIVYRDDSTKFSGGSGGTQTITLNASASQFTIIDAWSIDGGTTVFLNYIGQFQT